MPKNNRICFILLSALLICIMLHFATQKTVGLPTEAAWNVDGDAQVWRLAEHEGLIALYEEDAVLPAQIFDVWVAYLPDEDILALQSGIIINEKQELLRLLEDYTG